jgi:A/G-specific adenine glycosylase
MNQTELFFTRQLLAWNTFHNRRSMPWKGEKDPYKIWLSEIILQQTRVEQGLAYYERFIKKFPTILALAKAPEADVFKLWEGLGYYSRCKNLIFTAKHISNKLNGNFPDTYADLLTLKGVGPYTAAAIASFAYNLPYAVVDGNVFRVLARYFNNPVPIDSAEGKKQFTVLAERLLDSKQAGVYNQAIMDFGATICKPALPLCDSCPLSKKCASLGANTIHLLPLKEKTLLKKDRWFYYIILQYKGEIYVRKRTGKDIWENLYEFILVEASEALPLENWEEALQLSALTGAGGLTLRFLSGVKKQKLTHQNINGRFIHLEAGKKPAKLAGYERIPADKIRSLAFPRLITSYLDEKTRAVELF